MSILLFWEYWYYSGKTSGFGIQRSLSGLCRDIRLSSSNAMWQASPLLSQKSIHRTENLRCNTVTSYNSNFIQADSTSVSTLVKVQANPCFIAISIWFLFILGMLPIRVAVSAASFPLGRTIEITRHQSSKNYSKVIKNDDFLWLLNWKILLYHYSEHIMKR